MRKVLFVGLNDWIIRNLVKSNFGSSIRNSNIQLSGLVYKNNFSVFDKLLKEELNMDCFPMGTLQWYEHEAAIQQQLGKIDRGTLIRISRVGNKTMPIWSKSKKPESFLHRLKVDTKTIVGKLLSTVSLDRKLHADFLNTVSESVYVNNTCVPFLKEHQYDLIISCSPETPFDIPWLLAAKKLNVKTAILIRSWDNITSKISLIPKVDAAFLWSDLMEQEFDHYYPEHKHTEKIKIGSLQFDDHIKDNNILSYDKFCEITGLDASRPFITYATGGPHICKDEHLIVKQISNCIKELRLKDNPQLLVRVHPYSWGTNIDLNTDFGDAVLFPSKDKIHEKKGGTTLGLINDHAILLSTLFYQKLNINIASTFTIDSCIFDKPVINIAFDPYKVTYFEQSNARYYHYDHYKPLVQAKGVKVAYSVNDFKAAFNQYYHYPETDHNGRMKIVQMECGTVDGKAGERLAQGIVKLVSQ